MLQSGGSAPYNVERRRVQWKLYTSVVVGWTFIKRSLLLDFESGDDRRCANLGQQQPNCACWLSGFNRNNVK